jgi:hypothetical protein
MGVQMKTEEENLGYDASKHELIICKTLIWEENEETAEEFLQMCKKLHPNDERHIKHKKVEVYYRKKQPKVEKEKPVYNDADDFYGTKPKRKK